MIYVYIYIYKVQHTKTEMILPLLRRLLHILISRESAYKRKQNVRRTKNLQSRCCVKDTKENDCLKSVDVCHGHCTSIVKKETNR